MYLDIPSFVSALVKHPHPYQPFLPLLQREDPIPLLTSCVLSSLISQALVASSKPSTDLEEALVKLYSYLSTLAKNPDNAMQDIAVQHYSAVLRSTTARNLFWKQRKETLGPLVEILRTAAESARPGSSSSIRAASDASLGGGVGLQLLYHVLLVIWQLSFESSSIGEDINEYKSPFLVMMPRYLTPISIESMISSRSMSPFFGFLPKRKRHACYFPLYSSFFPQTARPCSRLLCWHVYRSCYRIYQASILMTKISRKT